MATTLDAKRLLRSEADLRRPWLHHLNADTSWLLQVPRSDSDSSGRAFFNLLIDPWFEGWQVSGHPLFHQQAHGEPSAIRRISDLEAFMRDTEAVARELRLGQTPDSVPDREESGETLLDAVAVSLEISDHCNKDALLQIDPRVPCFALKRSAKMIQCWNHFEKVFILPFWTSGSNWQSASVSILPGQISIAGLKQPDDKNRLQLYYGFMITFDLQSQSQRRDSPFSDQLDRGRMQQQQSMSTRSTWEAIAYLPHGICPNYLNHLAAPSPPLRYLALMSCLHLVQFGIPFGGWNFDSNLGAHSALQTQRLLQSKYWLGTHDEENKEKQGFTSLLEDRTKLTFEDAIRHSLEPEEVEKAPIGTDWAELGNGESKVLLQ